MSLNATQRKKTSEELKENLRISGLTPEDICTALDLSAQELHAVLALESEQPTDVWRVRDHMERVILAQGKEPYPYSSLVTNIWYRYD